jgi:hypothetical protein
VTRTSRGFGVGHSHLDFRNTLFFTADTTGKSGTPSLVSAMRFSIFGLRCAAGGYPVEYLYCTVHYCDAAGKVIDKLALPRCEIKGDSTNITNPCYYDVPVPDGYFIASVAFNDAIQYARACEINLAGIATFHPDPADYHIPDLRFAFTGTTGDGHRLNGHARLAINPDLEKILRGGAAISAAPGLGVAERLTPKHSSAGRNACSDAQAVIADARREPTPASGKEQRLLFDDLFEHKDELELLLEMTTWDGASRVFAKAGYENKSATLDLQFLTDIGSELKIVTHDGTSGVSHRQTIVMEGYDFTRQVHNTDEAAELLRDILRDDRRPAVRQTLQRMWEGTKPPQG